MNGYNFNFEIFDDWLTKIEEKTESPLFTIAFTKGDVGEVKQLDPMFIPLEEKFFKNEDGVLVLDIGALKEAIENYDPSPGPK